MSQFSLSKLVVGQFKAIRASGEVPLTPLTVFIGNNGVGKSSLIEALEAYCDVVTEGVDKGFERWYGIDGAWNKASSHRRQVTKGRGERYESPLLMRLKGRWGRGAYISRLQCGLDVGKNRGRIEEEFLRLPGGRVYRRDASGRCESFNDKELERVRKVPISESAAPQDWVNLLRSWQFLRLNPERLAVPARSRRSISTPFLERDGSNIGQYLLTLREASLDAFNGLLDALKYVVPYARDIQVAVEESFDRRAYIELTEEAFKLPAWLLSTGTLRIVALLAALRHPQPPPLLVVEEVENGLDPRTLHLVVEEISAAIEAGTTQVILTTHSPYLLDLLDLSHLVLVERVEGQPVFHRPADDDELRRWAESFSPGQLYTMGRLSARKGTGK